LQANAGAALASVWGRCPTLLIVGQYDPQTPVRISRALDDRIPDSRLSVLGRSGHSPFVEEPERFRQVLTEFLGEGNGLPAWA
jgi:pimeloyl-ACP methyl ester carboxylesterase